MDWCSSKLCCSRVNYVRITYWVPGIVLKINYLSLTSRSFMGELGKETTVISAIICEPKQVQKEWTTWVS